MCCLLPFLPLPGPLSWTTLRLKGIHGHVSLDTPLPSSEVSSLCPWSIQHVRGQDLFFDGSSTLCCWSGSVGWQIGSLPTRRMSGVDKLSSLSFVVFLSHFPSLPFSSSFSPLFGLFQILFTEVSFPILCSVL